MPPIHSVFDRNAIAAACRVDRIFLRDEVDSTNNWAIEQSDEESNSTELYLACVQTAGRGRGTNEWHSEHGSLAFSLSLPLTMSLDDDRRHWLPLAAGCGIASVVTGLVVAAGIKWPNDVYLNQRKLAGILVESAAAGARVVIGCGVNVNNRVDQVPGAISVLDALGRSVDLQQTLVEIVNAVIARVEIVESMSEELLSEMRRLDVLNGQRLIWKLGDNEISAIGNGIANDGSLIIETDNGKKHVHSGTVLWPLP